MQIVGDINPYYAAYINFNQIGDQVFMVDLGRVVEYAWFWQIHMCDKLTKVIEQWTLNSPY